MNLSDKIVVGKCLWKILKFRNTVNFFQFNSLLFEVYTVFFVFNFMLTNEPILTNLIPFELYYRVQHFDKFLFRFFKESQRKMKIKK